MPILAIASKTDNYYMQEQVKLARFAQGRFDICDTDNGTSGILLITQHPKIQSTIFNWVKKEIPISNVPQTQQ